MAPSEPPSTIPGAAEAGESHARGALRIARGAGGALSDSGGSVLQVAVFWSHIMGPSCGCPHDERPIVWGLYEGPCFWKRPYSDFSQSQYQTPSTSRMILPMILASTLTGGHGVAASGGASKGVNFKS